MINEINDILFRYDPENLRHWGIAPDEYILEAQLISRRLKALTSIPNIEELIDIVEEIFFYMFHTGTSATGNKVILKNNRDREEFRPIAKAILELDL